MAFGFDPGIYAFLQRRESLFRDVSIEGTFQERMRVLKDKMSRMTDQKPTVVVLGAGPAGLMRAIQSISNGNPTRVIEKRSESAAGRINTVALTETTIGILKYCGIYQYLIEHNQIFPPNRGGYIMVRLEDLEKAMKAVLKELQPASVIQYDTQVERVDAQGEKIGIALQSNGAREQISGVDILVNAEGSNSSTNALLNITREPVLPKIPVIAAVYQDKRPSIRGPVSLIQYVGRSVEYTAKTVYYHAIFLFQFLFSPGFRKQITGALILKTPGQNYVGCGFSDEINEKLLALKETGDEKEYQAFARKWINLSICAANMVAFFSRFRRGPHYLVMGGHQSLDKFDLIKIGADKASEPCKKINQAVVLLSGDACATVDPTTGLGCNTAIQSSTAFLDFIWDANDHVALDKRIEDYRSSIQEKIRYIHNASKELRARYRPDAVTVS
jgi:2-polyprenyl-6-methoxyphenol hydroxylase-like FAD-dependent oxidoreductase